MVFTTTDFQCVGGVARFTGDEVLEKNIHFLLVFMMGKMSKKVKEADVSGRVSSWMFLWLRWVEVASAVVLRGVKVGVGKEAEAEGQDGVLKQ